MPLIREVLTRRQIAALPSAREVEVHGDNGQFPRVVEGIAVDSHPIAQAVTTAVVPDNSAFFSDSAGSLTDDHDPTLGACVKQRIDPALCV